MHFFKRCEIELGPASDKLTGQQKVIIVFLAMGLSNKVIAELMNRSPETVAMHVKALLVAFNVENRAGIVGQAFCHGVLRPSLNAVSIVALGFLLGMGSLPQADDRQAFHRGPRPVRVTGSRYQQINLGVLTA